MLSRGGGPSLNSSTSRQKTLRAPVRGLVLNENLAGAKPQGALVLENWTPIARGMRIRKGSRLFATVGTDPVESMMAYYAGATKKLFGVADGEIFNISNVADPEVAPTADVSGLGASYFSYVNFTTSGGAYMPCVNGVDDLQLYDGSSWSVINSGSSPAITGVATADLVHVWVYRNRLFFVEKNSQRAWYLPVDSIGGAAGSISLSGIFQKGGKLLFGATWSLDAGDGIDDKCVFVSDLGEIIVFEGSNPQSASPEDWNLVGRYDGNPPMGARANMSAGGDLLTATTSGLVAVSASITKDSGAISLAAVSRNIEPLWTEIALDRDGLPWEIAKWPERQIAIVSTPVTSDGQRDQCFVINLETGAWAVYTGWNTRCLALHDGIVYFGTNGGLILEAEIGGDDNGEPYYAKYAGSWDHCGSEGVWKEFVSARATFRASRPFSPLLSIATDYTTEFPSAPVAAEGVESSLWDEGLWDVALWDSSGSDLVVNMLWQSQQGSGYVMSPQIQVTSGSASAPDCELVSFDIVWREGAFLT